MNEHLEILVPVKPRTGLAILKNLLWVVTALGVIASLLGILSIFPLIFAIITGVAAYFIGLRVDIEYEYNLTDKEIDIDVIFSKQNRKKITTIDLTKMEILAPANSARLDGYKHRECKDEDYTSHLEEHEKEKYVMYYDGSRKISLEMNERLLKAITNVAPHKVYTI